MNEGLLRLGFSLGLFLLLALVEMWRPARQAFGGSAKALSRRWATHVGLNVIASVLARVALALGVAGSLAGIAALAAHVGFGLLNQVAFGAFAEVLLALIVLDFAIWAQHLVMHKVPVLWRLHRVHHADTAMDVSTALRFHPLEILVSLAWKALVIACVGASPAAVIAFEIMLSGFAMLTHANVALGDRLERAARWAIITPQLHLIHHSPHQPDTDSNFGSSTSLWDRLFGTLHNSRTHPGDTIGLTEFRGAQDQTLMALLSNPFRQQRRESNVPFL